MRYDDPALRSALAAEYALGTLRGAARRRFERLIAAHPSWRREVDRWQTRLAGMAETIPAVEPPPRLWRTIEARVPGSAADGLQRALRRWRGLALAATAAALILGTAVVLRPAPAPTGVALLSDAAARPGWVLTLQRRDGRAELQVRAAAPALPGPGQAYELWLLPGGGAAPVSLGLLPAAGARTVPLDAGQAAMLARARGLAVSLELAGGSPTGQPTGPVVYQGRLDEV
ncbi:MAG: anti-sigma factor [Pseudomonadota bacterium]